ncbi:MAG: M20/M25/M40 family metallo-hydrolase [bacterium]
MAQRASKTDKKSISSLKENIAFLASDDLGGRRAGDPGEQLAAEFIAGKFNASGLTPKGNDGGYFQPFIINDGKELAPGSYLRLGGKELRPMVDFFPISNSMSSDIAAADVSPELKENGQPWIIDLAESIDQDKLHPHADLSALVSEMLSNAKLKGATAAILYHSKSSNDFLTFDPKDRSVTTPIPAVYLRKKAAEEHLKDLSLSYRVELGFSFKPKTRTARNVIGLIDNNAPLTIVIGAHYDHLGYGEDGNSMIRGGDPAIHNGADDNASGTAAIIELAAQLSKAKNTQYNYLFIAFSAEELGLFGSKYFVENPTIPLGSVNYMINLDMVGRLNDSTKTITIGGYGTSPSWQNMINTVKNKQFNIRVDSSGSGPSDHTSFYRKDIPVLFFFTGLHTDYHKPSDDAEKINYQGTLHITKFIREMILADKSSQKIAFTKTREQQTTTSARFSVSMGIMPDYSFSGTGVRVDGVSDNKPAKKAGLLAGDIVKQLGKYQISSVESYMQALSTFKKGDQTAVVVSRGEKEITFEITF